MKEVYGIKAPSLITIKRWASKFRRGEEEAEDQYRSGRSKRSNLLDPILSLLEKYPFYSAKKISKELIAPYTTIIKVMKEQLNLKKYFSKWIPYRITEELKEKRMEYCREMLEIVRNKKKISLL